MVESLYSDFDADLTIRPANSKTFYEKELNLETIAKSQGVITLSKAIEETVVLKHEEKWVNANIIGVDSTFIQIAKLDDHMVDGFPVLENNFKPTGIIGASLLDKLEGYLPPKGGVESILVYGPKRKIKMRLGKSPFNLERLDVIGRMNYNREVNAEFLVVPNNFAKEVLDYNEDEYSALYIDVDNTYDKFEVKDQLQKLVGANFIVKTNDEKNELIFKTSKTERMFVLVTLVFIFILASFNLVSSITMLFVEKKDDLDTLRSMGGNKRFMFNIFFFEGLLISAKGIIIGLVLGYAVCFSQIQFALLQMPNSGGEAFPVVVKLMDLFIILTLVVGLSAIASYFPVKMLIKRNLKVD